MEASPTTSQGLFQYEMPGVVGFMGTNHGNGGGVIAHTSPFVPDSRGGQPFHQGEFAWVPISGSYGFTVSEGIIGKDAIDSLERGCHVICMNMSKPCVWCGRRITWRKKWEKNWEDVRYCSQRCRSQRRLDVDEKLEEAILLLCRERGRKKSICPSEASRHVLPDGWRDSMKRTRWAAARLVSQGKIEMTQGGKVVDPSDASGPYRLRLGRGD